MVLQGKEDNLYKSMYELQKLTIIYNFRIFTTKTKVNGFSREISSSIKNNVSQ